MTLIATEDDDVAGAEGPALPRRRQDDGPCLAGEVFACARHATGGRIVAVGTTVVRALEQAAARDAVVRAGEGVATERIGPTSRLRVVDAILSGTHEPGSSHYELLRAFADEATLRRADRELEAGGYRTHEFGDSVLIERRARGAACAPVWRHRATA